MKSPYGSLTFRSVQSRKTNVGCNNVNNKKKNKRYHKGGGYLRGICKIFFFILPISLILIFTSVTIRP